MVSELVENFIEYYEIWGLGAVRVYERFFDENVDNFTKVDALVFLEYFITSNHNKEMAKKLVEIIDNNDALLKSCYDGKLSPGGFNCISDFIFDSKVIIFNTEVNKENTTLNKLLHCSFNDENNINMDFIRSIINIIKNTEYVFEMLISTVSDIEKRRGYIRSLVFQMDKINNQTAIMCAPYLLNKDYYWDFINRVENKECIELYVIATKNKEIIAYYIYKSGRYDLIYELFKDEETYINICSEVFNQNVIFNIKRSLRDGYRYVDENIEEYLNKSNEKIDIKFY